MHTFRKKWIAFSFLSGYALAGSGLVLAGDITAAAARDGLPAREIPADQAPAQETLAIFLAAEEADTAPAIGHTLAGADAAVADAAATVTPQRATPAPLADWVAVDTEVLAQMRGGFDLAPGLKVSFGIERLVNLNGVLQTATRIEVPDAVKLAQLPQSPAALAIASGTAGNTAAAASATTATPAGTMVLPVAQGQGNGAATLIQNGLGNMFAPGALSPETAATIIQNSASNQTIQSLTIINAATNSLEFLKGANLQSTLLDALTRSTRSP